MSDRVGCPDLLGYLEDRLGPARRRKVEEHLQTCSDCDRRLRTYRELSHPWSCTTQAPSMLLAEYAVRPERINAADRMALVAHLECCDQCRAELELGRASLGRARQEPFGAPLRPRFVLRWVNPARAAIAASLVLLTAAGAWLLHRPPDQTAGTELPAPPVLDTPETVQGRVAMVIENTRIRAGGELSIRTPGAVAFGNGFSVGPGARLRVEILQTKPAADENPAGPEN